MSRIVIVGGRFNQVDGLWKRNAKISLEATSLLAREAMRWSSIARGRERWRTETESREKVGEQSRETLKLFGIGEPELAKLAHLELLEVQIPFESESKDWAARVLPWELLLTEALRRPDCQAPVVVRQLKRSSTQEADRARDPALRPYIVVSAPGLVGRTFTFQSEIELVQRNLTNPEIVRNPTLQGLQSSLAAPDLVHVAGVDPVQYRQICQWEGFDEAEEPMDGVVFAGAGPLPSEESAEAVARALGASRPRLVVFNVYRSAPRTAALAVAEGALAAIGFQNAFDGFAAEVFFNRLYHLLTEKPLHASFVDAFSSLRGVDGGVGGTALVLWSERSAFGRVRTAYFSTARPQPVNASPSVDVAPLKRLNYALLHNGMPLFEKFVVSAGNPPAAAVDVAVELALGSHTASWRQRVDFGRRLGTPRGVESLADRVALPLIWSEIARLNEDVRSVLTVRVSSSTGEVVYDQSHRVTLPPPFEWEDGDDSRYWLPSFVFRNDGAIEGIVRDARKYLAALTGEIDAGFDGYQSLEGRPKDGVLLQVEAVWHALLFDHRLQYTNPLAGTGLGRQRLRTPTNILRSGRGTCLDLALLLGAALENIGVYPTIFLFSGHAFGGYWSSPKALAEFVAGGTKSRPEEQPNEKPEDPWPWYFPGEEHYQRVRRAVVEGGLVPIETTRLTSGGSLADAVKAALTRLDRPHEFDALLDIRTARRSDVTTLPLSGELA